MQQVNFKTGKIVILFLGIVFGNFFIGGCKKNTDDRTVIYNIEPELGYIAPRPPAPPSSPANIPAMKLVETGAKDTVYLTLNRIDGFTYTEGYNYVVKVSVKRISNPPGDGYLESYKLIEVISKQKSSN